MDNKLGTRARIPDGSRVWITTRALAWPRLKRIELAEELQKELKRKGYDVPEIEVLTRMISTARRAPELPEDKPFSLGVLIKHPIPPEALPVVMRVWAKRLEEAKPDKDGFSYQMPFTIRHALWVARLSKLSKDPEDIWSMAFWYSVRDRAYEVIGKTMDTADLDTVLLDKLFGSDKPTKGKQKGGTTK